MAKTLCLAIALVLVARASAGPMPADPISHDSVSCRGIPKWDKDHTYQIGDKVKLDRGDGYAWKEYKCNVSNKKGGIGPAGSSDWSYVADCSDY